MDSNLKGGKPVMPELAKLDATAQAALVAKGEVTALELVEAGISRIEQVNPKINAVVGTFYDRAREAAKGKLPQGPFTGVPNLVKDLDNLKGTSATSGSRFLAQNISPETDPIIASCEAAGFVMVGKSNTPEFGTSKMASTPSTSSQRRVWVEPTSALLR